MTISAYDPGIEEGNQSELFKTMTTKFTQALKTIHPEKYIIKLNEKPKEISLHPDFIFNKKRSKKIGFSFNGDYTPKPNRTTAQAIIIQTASRHGLSVNELIGDRRTLPIVMARFEAIDEMRNRLGWSASRIGRELGGRGHAAILSAFTRIAALKAAGKWDA